MSSSSSLAAAVVVVLMALVSLPPLHVTVIPMVNAIPSGMPVLGSIPTTLGPLEDAACNVEDLEQANEKQLFMILQEIKTTQFFRNFVVDLDAKCPLQSWRSGSAGGSSNKKESSAIFTTSDPNAGGEEAEFQCGGGGTEQDEEDDPDAPPRCHVEAPEADLGFLGSNALFSLKQGGFSSQAQQDTFKWKKQTNMVVEEGAEACEENNFLLPDAFWMDMCSQIQSDNTKVVNLALNPERNTGYNGTHIWKAIYDENCIFASSMQNNSKVTLPGTDRSADMCLEERVLYRLLSGLHTSTTLSIAMNYYPPSKRKGREQWEPNPSYFMEKFQDNTQHIRNLHFSYVVLLRAIRKAKEYLYDYEIRTGDIVEDEKASVLLKRLLDSAILQSCSAVFTAFDESLLFQEGEYDVLTLKKNFKGVFHNVSSILDCVQCQQCKLHGKMAMLGYGAALKILFMSQPELERNEIVALIQTVAKFSESIHEIRELTHMYWQEHQEKVKALMPNANTLTSLSSTTTNQPAQIDSLDVVDNALGAIAAMSESLGWQEESDLVQKALARDSTLLLLAKHYGAQSQKLLDLLQKQGLVSAGSNEPDAIVIGSGLAGMAATLSILDRGGRVIIIEKEHLLGGNSNKASSGINAYVEGEADADTLDLFRNDTIRSAGSSARPDLIDVLVQNSGAAVQWLRERVGVDLSLKAQLGGHSSKRTHRPSNGMAGAEIIYGLQKAIRKFEASGQVQIRVDSKVQKLLTDAQGTVVGVQFINVRTGDIQELRAPHVILATGGFAADRSMGSYLEQYRPELLKMPTTAGPFSTGDGITMAKELGIGTVDMDKIQVHPTGWVDPADPDNTSKVLAAELMRGVGGILINKQGKRFCDELGTRSYVTKQMLSHDKHFRQTSTWSIESEIPTFFLVLAESAAKDAQKHVDLYSHKGLLTKFVGVRALAEWMGISESVLVTTWRQYQAAASKGIDQFNKTTFRGLPGMNLDTEIFYAGTVTPVLHYCMGGIKIDKDGHVINEHGAAVRGLYAVGEVTGGVHGVNRLAGNSLLECTVFGRIVGQSIPVSNVRIVSSPSGSSQTTASNVATSKAPRKVSVSELQQHNTPDNCWVAIHGTVYDMTTFAEEHPAGPESIHALAGKDGTEAFSAVHNANILDDFLEEKIGLLES